MPQLFKQLLMVSGFEKYFQIVRCFRDEDLRADRQPEFTQIDLELSFVTREDVIQVIEGLVREVVRQVKGEELPDPLPRLTYAEAMDRYGSDKPDLRFGMELRNVSDLVKDSDFQVFSKVVSSGGVVKGLAVPTGASFARSRIDGLTKRATELGAKGLAWISHRKERSSLHCDSSLRMCCSRLPGWRQTRGSVDLGGRYSGGQSVLGGAGGGQ